MGSVIENSDIWALNGGGCCGPRFFLGALGGGGLAAARISAAVLGIMEDEAGEKEGPLVGGTWFRVGQMTAA